MKALQTKDLIRAIAKGDTKRLSDVKEQIETSEVSAENIILALHYLKDNGRPEGWQKRELLDFFPEPTTITDQSIQLAKEGLDAYSEHNDYIKLLRGCFEIIMEGMQCYFTLRESNQLALLNQYKN